MRLQVINVAQKLPDWAEAACSEYQKRMPPEIKPQLLSLPLPSAGAKQNAARQRQQETDLILKQLARGGFNLALDENGELWSSQDWARHLQRWMFEFPQVNLVIGGPDGLSRASLEACQQRISLGRMTLPHALVKVVVMEQLYRAWTIVKGHPYHRE